MSERDAKRLANADEVEALYTQGYTQLQIAEKLGVAPSTVHRRRAIGRALRRKLATAAPERAPTLWELPAFVRWDMPGDKPDDLGYDDLDDDVPIEDLINERK